MLVKNAMNGGAGDSVGLRQLSQTSTLAAIPQDADAIEVEWFAANVAAFQLGAAHASAQPLDDEVAFEFRNGADDHDDGPAQWACGVELLPETDKLDMEMIEFVQHFEEVFYGSGQTVGGPNQDRIETVAARILHHLIETGTPGFSAADAIGVLVDDLVVALRGHLAKVKQLRFRVLIEGRNSQIQGGALHGRSEMIVSHI